MCLKLPLRDDFERLIWCLDHWLSCMFDCIHVSVFLFLKNCFEKLTRHHLDTFSTPGYLSSFQAFSYCNLNTSSTPGGSIEPHLLWLMFWTLTLSKHLYLSTAKSSTLGSTPLDTFICLELYWGSIYSSSCDSNLISLDLSLSIALSLHLPNTLISLPIFSLRFLQAFSRVSSLGKLLISHSSCISCFET